MSGAVRLADIAIMYIKDIADPQIVGNIRSKIEQIDIDALPMAEKNGRRIYYPFFLEPLSGSSLYRAAPMWPRRTWLRDMSSLSSIPRPR